MDAIGKTLKELELAGYIIRRQLRGKDGRISDTEYTIFEKPRKPSPPDTTLPDTENPYLDNPDTEAPDTDNPAQLNTKKAQRILAVCTVGIDRFGLVPNGLQQGVIVDVFQKLVDLRFRIADLRTLAEQRGQRFLGLLSFFVVVTLIE